MAGKRILVTGADGFIGSHLTEHLVRLGANVRAFVLYNSFNSWGWLDDVDPEIQKAIEVFAGDIRDPHGVRTAMRDCDVVMHLAALIAIPYSYHSPDAYVDTNVKGTLNLLTAAKEFGVKKFVHTSTSEVYGTAQYVPIDEKHPLNAQSPYAATKVGADQMAIAFQRSFALPVAVIRPFKPEGCWAAQHQSAATTSLLTRRRRWAVIRPSTLEVCWVPGHRSAVVRDWLTRHKAQIEVFHLPSYSPELNPDEGLNADLKQHITRKAPLRSKQALKQAAISHLHRLSKSPARVRSFFHQKSMRYAA